MKNPIRSPALLLAALALIAVLGAAVALAENIDPSNDGSQYAWGENVGWLNAEPSGDGMWGIHVTDTWVVGYMWGENIGWISLCCWNTDSCDTLPYCVANDDAGNLYGYAWGENVGWISFSCVNTGSCASANYGVTINPLTGVFSGNAWGENTGWVTFSDDDPVEYGVVTSWRGPLSDENIDPSNDGSQYAWGENVGWLNAEPTGDGGPGIEVTDTHLEGYMWGENIGWVSLACENTASCGTQDYGVDNDNGGNLSGYAWGENVGWISFWCGNTNSCDDAQYRLQIDPLSGTFSGNAWGENIGWITFSDDDPVEYQVTTSWSSPCPGGGDIDSDGFDDEIEWYLPSDCLDDCTNDPGVHDAWPLDINIDTFVTVVGDVLPYSGRIGATGGPPPSGNWMQRLDLNMDNFITVVGDVLKFAGKMGASCT
jgi:hypothetical protein